MGRKAGPNNEVPGNRLPACDPDEPLRSPIGCVHYVIGEMCRWMADDVKVKGFTKFSKDDHMRYANDLWRYLETETCTCGGEDRCRKQHRMAAFSGADVQHRFHFVRRAVIGPMGWLAQSIEQGMFYRLVLKPQLGMLVARVALKVCANCACGRRYEEPECPGCGLPFDPTTTPVIGESRLLLPDEYSCEDWWPCGAKGARVGSSRERQSKPKWRGMHEATPRNYWAEHPSIGEHYYPQQACANGRHGVSHDCCPLATCPLRQEGQAGRHRERPKVLFVNRGPKKIVPVGQSPPAALIRDAIETGLRRGLMVMNDAQRQKLEQLFANDHPEGWTKSTDCFQVAQWLFSPRAQALEPKLLQPLREVIRSELQDRGLEIDPSGD
jgi:hypothetical protein